ncbi:MAG: DUF2589 domain-containing protein [Lachnoclostridium sp.]|nr:DUF2589 domain-containing protein [Lachnoclostridium sp.]
MFSRWNGRDKKKTKEESMTLSDVIRGIQHCVNSSIEIVEQHYLNELQKYVTEDNKIKTERIFLDDVHYMDIPLISLTSHNALEVDEMKIKMRVNIRDADVKKATVITENAGGGENRRNNSNEENETYDVSRSSMMVDVCNVSRDGDGANMEIQMKFKVSEPPESLSRMLDALNNSIVVKLKELKEETGN